MKADCVRPSLFAPRFLTRLRATGPQDENPRFEGVLGVSRVFLGATSLIVDLTHPLAPDPYNQLLIFLLLVYCVESLGFLIWLALNPEPGRAFVIIMQVSDIFWPIVFCLFGDPPTGLVFAFFLFALMTTAFRFGMYETALTAVGSVLLLIFQETIVAYGPKGLGQVLYTPVNISRLVLRCGFLLMTGFLLGYLAEREKELRAEIAFTNRLLSQARVGSPLSEVVTGISRDVARVFNGESMYDVVAQSSSRRLFRWDIRREPQSGYELRELSAGEYAAAVMVEYPHTFYIERHNNGKMTIDAVDDEGRRV